MKLDKFDKNKKYKNIFLTLGLFVLVFGGGFLLYRSYANYEENKSYNVLKGQVGNFIKNDVNIIAMSLDGQEINYTPEKNDYLVNVKCDKEAEAYWDTDIWGLVVKDFEKGIKCSVYFETKYLTNYIKYLAKSSDELLEDETEDKNIRYVGGNPNNYVLFNNELWRIIGVMNNVQNESGESETRVKLVRAQSIGQYSWDYKADGTYSGDWSTSTLQELLNGAYYNKTTGTYYNYVKDTEPTPINVDFTEIGLSEEARNQIGVASWNITAIPFGAKTIEEYIKAEKYYSANIGLIGKVDLALATNGSETTSRSECLNKRIYVGWDENGCGSNDWLRIFRGDNYTISVSTEDSKRINQFNGQYCVCYALRGIFPSVYLKSNVYYDSGTGSSTDPFIIK